MITLNQDQFSKGFYDRLSKIAIQVPQTNAAPVKADAAPASVAAPNAKAPAAAPATTGVAGHAPAGTQPAAPIPERTIPPSTSPPDKPVLPHFNNASDAAWNGARDGAANNIHMPSASDFFHHPFDSTWNATVGNVEGAAKGAFNGAVTNTSQFGGDAATKRIADNANAAGLATNRDANGLPTGVNVGQTFSNMVGNPLMDEGKKLMSGDFSSLGGFAQEHPWLTGGAAALGAGGLYGGYKLLSGMMGGGDEQQAQGGSQQQGSYLRGGSYGVPQPQALMKASMVKKALGMPSPFTIPTMAAGFLAGEEPKKPQQMVMATPPQPQQFNIHSGDPRVRQMLQNPEMRAYIQNIVAGT